MCVYPTFNESWGIYKSKVLALRFKVHIKISSPLICINKIPRCLYNISNHELLTENVEELQMSTGNIYFKDRLEISSKMLKKKVVAYTNFLVSW